MTQALNLANFANKLNSSGQTSNSGLQNSTISGIPLGSNLATLTIGAGLSGTSYNGSSAVSIANTGVTSLTAGAGISLSASTGGITIVNSATGATISTAKSATGTSILFTGLPANCKRISFGLFGVANGGSSDFILQLGTAGGIITSGYISTAFTQNGGFQMVGKNNSNGLILTNGTQSSAWYGFINLMLVGTNQWAFSGGMSNSANPYGATSSGGISLGSAITQIQLTTVNGSDAYSSGTVNIIYE